MGIEYSMQSIKIKIAELFEKTLNTLSYFMIYYEYRLFY